MIFDANAHPTVTGTWSPKTLDASFERLARDVEANGFRGACAVGVAGLEAYEHRAFAKRCAAFPSLVPIAGATVGTDEEMDRDLGLIQDLGFRAVKIHPRAPLVRLTDPRLTRFFALATRRGLPIFFCTYVHAPIADYPETDPFFDLVGILKRVPDARVLLVHGGDVRLLQYTELVRFHPNLLLDLSQTLMKYAGSSIDDDIRFTFQRFDRRICIGSDFPEHCLADVKRRFEHFAEGISQEKRENVAFRNIEAFLGLSSEGRPNP